MTSKDRTVEAVIEQLRGVKDPELNVDIVELGMIKEITFQDTTAVTVEIALTTLKCPLRERIRSDIQRALCGAEALNISTVNFKVVEMDKAAKANAMMKAREVAKRKMRSTSLNPSIKVIALASGKGGVGKSSLSVQIARQFAKMGYQVGLLDADIWGYSTVRMLMGEAKVRLDAQGDAENFKIQPHILNVGSGNLLLVSMGLLADSDDEAIMWRGLMLSRALQHFVEDVEWGDLDYLFIDMPPGTGDIHLTLSRLLPETKVLVVTTPSRDVTKVAKRVADMCQKTQMEIVGVVENMSYFVCEHGTQHELFGTGGGATLAEEVHVELLAQIPLVPELSDFPKESPSDTSTYEVALRQLQAKVEAWFTAREETLEGCSSRILKIFEKLEATI